MKFVKTLADLHHKNHEYHTFKEKKTNSQKDSWKKKAGGGERVTYRILFGRRGSTASLLLLVRSMAAAVVVDGGDGVEDVRGEGEIPGE